eukprot:TRINITY_DN6283_c0_g3_i2.p1 TRINITY_DN6283_c0_g3~~TRINITY_DN6283_c0_g3_i2.p1  ORF type:complete len:165 (+),score=27.98 TRINITY_DN6283_c0_g3_i2:16-510(+)
MIIRDPENNIMILSLLEQLWNYSYSDFKMKKDLFRIIPGIPWQTTAKASLSIWEGFPSLISIFFQSSHDLVHSSFIPKVFVELEVQLGLKIHWIESHLELWLCTYDFDLNERLLLDGFEEEFEARQDTRRNHKYCCTQQSQTCQNIFCVQQNVTADVHLGGGIS